MNKIFVILFVIFCSFFNLSCATEEDEWINDYVLYPKTINDNSDQQVMPPYEFLMEINGNPPNTVQGGDVYDKYFFQGFNNNAFLDVYDIENKKYICRLIIPSPQPSARCHVNSVCFGNQRADSKDFFPLLYISSGYSLNGNSSDYFVYVYRVIKDDNDNFEISLVQTITLSEFGKDGWTEGIPDVENNKFWVKYGGRYYVCFDMPKIEDGDIILKHGEGIKEIDLGLQPYNSSNQDHLFVNNRILLVSGIPNTGQRLLFIAINTLTGEREVIIDLQKLGIKEEPESISLYRDQLLIGTWYHLYKVNFYDYKQ